MPEHDSSPLLRLIEALTVQSGLTLSILLGLSAALGWWGAHIPVKGDMEALLPPESPSVTRAQELRSRLGQRSALTLIIGGDDRRTNLDCAAQIAEELRELSADIAWVDFKRDTRVFEDNALLFLDLNTLESLKEQVDAVITKAIKAEMAIDDLSAEDETGVKRTRLPNKEALLAPHQAKVLSTYQESAEGRVVALSAFPRFKPEDITRSRALMNTVDDIVSRASQGTSITYVFEGDYTGVSRSVNQLSVALQRSSLIALLGVVLLLTLYFKRARAVLLVLVPLVCGLAWTAALTRLVIGELNLISAFIFAILIGLGIDFSVHALSRIDEERAKGHSQKRALILALGKLGPAMFSAAGTSVATFASLLFFDFRGFSHFGAIAAMGLLLTLSALYLVLPPLSMLLSSDPRGHQPSPVKHVSVSSGSALWAKLSLLGIGVACLLAAQEVSHLRLDGDMRVMRMKSQEELDVLKRVYREEIAGAAPSPAIIMTEGPEEAEELTRYLTKELPRNARLDAIASLYSFVPEEQDTKRTLISELRRRIAQKLGLLRGQDKADAEALMPYLNPSGLNAEELPKWVRKRFEDADGQVGRVVYLFPRGIKARAEEVLDIQASIGSFTLNGSTYYASAPWMFSGEAYAKVKEEGPIALGLAALLVLLLLSIDLRRISLTLKAFLPLLAGILISLGLALQLGLVLNLFNIIVLPVIFGIGVDTAIHLIHRRRQGSSLEITLRTTGKAAILSALTTAIGFGSLWSAPSVGLQSIAQLALIGVLGTTCVTTLGIAALERLTDPAP